MVGFGDPEREAAPPFGEVVDPESQKVVDTIEPGYPWYREAYSVDKDGAILGRALVVTKMYRVLPRPRGIGEEPAAPVPSASPGVE